MANEKRRETEVSNHEPSCAIKPTKGASSPLMPPRRVMIVMSPKAGTGLGREQLPQLIDRLQQAGVEVTATDKISDLQQFDSRAQQEPTGADLVVAAGGDGTVSLVAEHVTPRIPMVPMPLGTENLLARQFGYTSAAESVFDTIVRGDSYWLDAGRANGKLFLVMASCGFDAEVVRALHLTRKGHINRLSYAGPIWRAMRRYHFPALRVRMDAAVGADAGAQPAAIVTDAIGDSPCGDAVTNGPPSSGPPSSGPPLGRSRSSDSLAGERPVLQTDSAESTSIRCCWAMVFNLPKYGGDLLIEPDAVGNDGRLDAILFTRGSLWSGLRYVAGIKLGRHQRFQDVVRRTAKRVHITSDQRVPYQLDGDYAGHLPLTIETIPQRIHLRVPVTPG
tara:strand:- start:235836 stop:237008 length:1173 start_codon:yes stop_codon:yes gene_type:complete